jgi:hypothetical protein
MIIKSKGMDIAVKNIYSETIRQNGKNFPAFRFVFDGGVTADELDALSSGAFEMYDDDGQIVGSHEGYTTRKELSFVLGKITTAEQERDELAAALAAEEAKQPYIESLTAAIDDAVASTVIPLFPAMKYTGNLIKAGTRINWNGVLKRAAVDLWDREDCDPSHAPELWEDILYRNGYRIIPDVITVGKAFAYGERGWWKDGLLYESIVNDNVYTPEEYAGNWKIVEEV